MLIRSQDGLKLINFNNVELIRIDGTKVYAFTMSETYVLLGEYKTKERALKVLDDISFWEMEHGLVTPIQMPEDDV